MLKNKISLEIFNNKKIISIEEFIEICLYSKKGYYNSSEVLGSQGDFITSPEISQLFGEILGLFIYEYWKNYINKPFNLIELGPGRATLLIDILRITDNFKVFKKNAKIFLIEKSKNLIKEQKKNLEKYSLDLKKITWKSDFDLKKNIPSIVFANEFFDCLPISQFFKKDNQWFEKMLEIDYENNKIKFTNNKIIDPEILNKIIKYQSNEILEISKSRENYFNKICKYISKSGGLIIIIDYGYFNKPSNFTLQSVYNNKKTNIFDNIGKQDISSLVDFKKLIELGKMNNLDINIFCSQREFLLEYGVRERAKKIKAKATKKQKVEIESGLKRIINDKNMGSVFKVLVLSKRK